MFGTDSKKEKKELALNTILITGMVLIVIIAAAAVSVVNFNSANNAIKVEITNTLNALSFSRANHIQDLLIATLDQTKALSELDLFQNNLNNVKNGVEVLDSTLAMQEALEDINDKTNAFYEIQVANLNGKIIASSSDISSEVDEAVGTNNSLEDFFIEGLKGSFISKAHVQEGISTVSYSSPISTDESPLPIGVLIIHQAFEKELNGERGSKEGLGINSITLDPEGLGETGEVYLVNSDKLRISPDRHDLDDDVFLKQEVDTVGYENCFIEGIAGDPYVNPEGDIVIGNAEPIEGTDWCIIAELGVEEAFAPIKTLRNRSIITSIILIFISIILSLLLSRYIAGQIGFLTAAVEKVSKGDLQTQLPQSNIKEIVSLTDSLNRVLASMKLAILKTGSTTQIKNKNTAKTAAANKNQVSSKRPAVNKPRNKTNQ